MTSPPKTAGGRLLGPKSSSPTAQKLQSSSSKRPRRFSLWSTGPQTSGSSRPLPDQLWVRGKPCQWTPFVVARGRPVDSTAPLGPAATTAVSSRSSQGSRKLGKCLKPSWGPAIRG